MSLKYPSTFDINCVHLWLNEDELQETAAPGNKK